MDKRREELRQENLHSYFSSRRWIWDESFLMSVPVEEGLIFFVGDGEALSILRHMISPCATRYSSYTCIREV